MYFVYSPPPDSQRISVIPSVVHNANVSFVIWKQKPLTVFQNVQRKKKKTHETSEELSNTGGRIHQVLSDYFRYQKLSRVITRDRCDNKSLKYYYYDKATAVGHER